MLLLLTAGGRPVWAARIHCVLQSWRLCGHSLMPPCRQHRRMPLVCRMALCFKVVASSAGWDWSEASALAGAGWAVSYSGRRDTTDSAESVILATGAAFMVGLSLLGWLCGLEELRKVASASGRLRPLRFGVAPFTAGCLAQKLQRWIQDEHDLSRLKEQKAHISLGIRRSPCNRLSPVRRIGETLRGSASDAANDAMTWCIITFGDFSSLPQN